METVVEPSIPCARWTSGLLFLSQTGGVGILEGGGVMIRVLVVLDGGFFGVHARSLLRRQPDIEVVDLLPLDNDLVDKAAALQPNVIVIDTEFMVSQVLPTASDLRARLPHTAVDRKSTRLNSSHPSISYAVF